MSRTVSLAACLLAVVLAGLNLRPALASIGPLLDALQASAKLSDSLASLLTSLPVLLMGLGALGAAQLLRYFGVRGGVTFGLLLIALACVLRLLPGQVGLLGGAVLAGLGIAACQALLPVFIRQRFGARIGGAMGAYSTAIMGGAVLASVASPWLAKAWGELPALAFWALPAVLALPVWIRTAKGAAPVSSAAPAFSGIARRGSWLALFFGLGTGAYVLVLAWLPPYYTALGWTPAQAGALLGGLTLTEVVAGLLVSAFIDRLPDRRPALLLAIVAARRPGRTGDVAAAVGTASHDRARPGHRRAVPAVADRRHGPRPQPCRSRCAGRLRAGRGLPDRGAVPAAGGAGSAIHGQPGAGLARHGAGVPGDARSRQPLRAAAPAPGAGAGLLRHPWQVHSGLG
ncbi:MFS transporter [Pseudomonas nitroreducens]|uniref:MFS transporter n=1 Tax=Pseudomonas nitroreducens TaxID=46680 RepID=UPI003D066F45